MALRSRTTTLTTDADGDASASLSVPTGRLEAVRVNPGGGAPATADVTIANMERNVVVLTDVPAAGRLAHIVGDSSGEDGAEVAAWKVHPIIHGNCTITIAQGGDTIEYAVTLFYS